jgi:hypothetical protein
VETTDWKIIQGGVKEISESTFATLTNNKRLQDAIKKSGKITAQLLEQRLLSVW